MGNFFLVQFSYKFAQGSLVGLFIPKQISMGVVPGLKGSRGQANVTVSGLVLLSYSGLIYQVFCKAFSVQGAGGGLGAVTLFLLNLRDN